MKDTLTLNSFNKRMVYRDSFSYPHRMDYIRITENYSNRNAAKNRNSDLNGSSAMWWVATAIVILSALFLLLITMS